MLAASSLFFPVAVLCTRAVPVELNRAMLERLFRSRVLSLSLFLREDAATQFPELAVFYGRNNEMGGPHLSLAGDLLSLDERSLGVIEKRLITASWVFRWDLVGGLSFFNFMEKS